jgi:hypothetical protein
LRLVTMLFKNTCMLDAFNMLSHQLSISEACGWLHCHDPQLLQFLQLTT